jgi:transcription elongation factor GreA
MNYQYLHKISTGKTLKLTKDGLDGLKNRLDMLRKDKRTIYDRLKSMDAKEKMDHLISVDEIKMLEDTESEVAKINEILRYATTIVSEKKPAKIMVGSIVRLYSFPRYVEYTVVSPLEADPVNNKISDDSPLGKVLIGKKVGESVLFTTKKGKESSYTIVELR